MRQASERRGRRVPLVTPVRVGGIAATCENLGEAGVFVTAPVTLEPGTPVDCEVLLQEAYRPFKGRVAWVRPADTRPPGMGIELVDLSDSQSRWLRQVVEADAGGHPVQVWLEGVSESVTGRAEIVDGAIRLRIALPFLSIGGPVAFAPVEDAEDRYAGRVAHMWLEAMPGKPAVVELEMSRKRARRTTLPGASDANLDAMVAEAAPLATPPEADVTIEEEIPIDDELLVRRTPWLGMTVVAALAVALVFWWTRPVPPQPAPRPIPAAAPEEPAAAAPAPAPERQPAPTPAEAAPEAEPDFDLPVEPAPAQVPTPPERFEVMTDGPDVQVLIPLRGASPRVTHYPLAHPDGVAVTVSAGRASIATGTYPVGKGGISQIWIREPEGSTQQIRIYFTPLREARVESTGGTLRVVVPPPAG